MTPDKTKIRASLEAMRAAFHKLLDEIPDGIWQQKPPGSAWPVCHDMWHVVQVQYVYAHAIRAMRKGRNYPLDFKAICDLLSLGVAYKLPARPGKQKVAAHFDDSLHILLAILDELDEHEWMLPGKLAGMKLTIYKIYRTLPNHFDEHAERAQELLYS